MYVAATAVALFFLLLIGLTWKKQKHTRTMLHTAVTPVSELPELLAKHARGFLLLLDEYTCVRTIAQLPLIIRLLEKEQIPWMIANAAEQFDPQKGICPICPYLQKFQVNSIPTLIYYEGEFAEKKLVFPGDRPDLKAIEQFLREVTALKNVS